LERDIVFEFLVGSINCIVWHCHCWLE